MTDKDTKLDGSYHGFFFDDSAKNPAFIQQLDPLSAWISREKWVSSETSVFNIKIPLVFYVNQAGRDYSVRVNGAPYMEAVISADFVQGSTDYPLYWQPFSKVDLIYADQQVPVTIVVPIYKQYNSGRVSTLTIIAPMEFTNQNPLAMLIRFPISFSAAVYHLSYVFYISLQLTDGLRKGPIRAIDKEIDLSVDLSECTWIWCESDDCTEWELLPGLSR